ncbi:MAG: HAD family hydrolase [Lentisphaeraceae bacterium]|nr:HAD family hydrolase [Lentisphaeraceae bacterium]
MKTVFIDRDGVINRRLVGDWVKTWEEFDMLPGVPEAIGNLKKAGYRCILITNQRGISLDLFTFDDLHSLHEKMNEKLLAEGGGCLDDIFICPHDRHHNCECRKPKPGLFHQAVEKYPDISLPETVMFGDKDTDREASEAAGCGGFFLIDEKISLLDCVNKFLSQQ